MAELTPDTVAKALRRDIDRSLAALASIASERDAAHEFITSIEAIRHMTEAFVTLHTLTSGLGETSAARFKEHITHAINACTTGELAAVLGRFSS